LGWFFVTRRAHQHWLDNPQFRNFKALSFAEKGKA
jgi:hypothetical protein